MWIRSFSLLLVLTVTVEAQRVKLTRRPYHRVAEVEVMADQYSAWISTRSEDCDVGGNWSNGIPDDNAGANKVDVVISRQATANLTQNIDNASVDLLLNSFRTEDGSTVGVGGPGNYMKCAIAYGTNSRFTHLGSGPTYFDNQADAGDYDCPVIYLDSPNEADALYLSCGAATDNITNVVALHGFLSISAESFVHNLYTGYSERFPSGRGPVVEIAAASFGFEDMVIDGGIIAVGARQLDEVDLYSGQITHTGLTFRPLMIRQLGGTYIYTGSGVLPEVIGLGGVLDIQQDYAEKTITKYVHSAAHELRADLNRTTITQDIPLADTDTGI